MKILAYQGIITKEEFIAELEKHQLQDNFISGTYGNENKDNLIFKGCAVGCSLESISRLKELHIDFGDHSKYPELLGIPEWLARVEDSIFEGVTKQRSKTWPVEFGKAINEGADLGKIKGRFLICVLESALTSFDHTQFPDVKKSIDTIIDLWKNDGTEEDFKYAASAASAAYAAAYAANAAYAAYAANAAAYAAANAAYAANAAAYVAYVAYAGYAANAANSAANAAANAAASAAYAANAAAYAAANAAYAAKWEYFADQLLIMMQECKGE